MYLLAKKDFTHSLTLYHGSAQVATTLRKFISAIKNIYLEITIVSHKTFPFDESRKNIWHFSQKVE